MALKDWKKFRNNKDWITWRSNKGVYLNIIQHLPKYGWDLKIVTKNNYPLVTKNFKTKPKAMKFAKSYMRKN